MRVLRRLQGFPGLPGPPNPVTARLQDAWATERKLRIEQKEILKKIDE